MSDGILKKTKRAAVDEARQIAKQVGREPTEFLAHTKSQALGLETHPKLDEQIVAGSGKIVAPTSTEEEEIKVRARKRLNELEEELNIIRQDRKVKEKEWQDTQAEKMQQNLPKTDEYKTLVQPTTKPRRGFLGLIKQKQGTKEMGKGPSG